MYLHFFLAKYSCAFNLAPSSRSKVPTTSQASTIFVSVGGRSLRFLSESGNVYYFCVVKMEQLYAIAVSFGKNVRNRGFPPTFYMEKQGALA